MPFIGLPRCAHSVEVPLPTKKRNLHDDTVSSDDDAVHSSGQSGYSSAVSTHSVSTVLCIPVVGFSEPGTRPGSETGTWVPGTTTVLIWFNFT